MNIYLISQTENTTYDSYDSAVVYAADEESARRTLPDIAGMFSDDEERPMVNDAGEFGRFRDWGSGPKWEIIDSWCRHISQVKVKHIGHTHDELQKPGVICAAFNVG